MSASELTIVGTGMIGASFALALRDRFDRINAIDTNDDHAQYVLANKIVDARVEQVPASSAMVLLACPSNRIGDWVVRLQGHTGTVFDVGSVKAAILEEVRARLGALPANFVPSHPIAGLERSGPQAARRDLFAGRAVIVTPAATTDSARLAAVTALWRHAGANVRELTPEAHDRIYARTSHLPHLLAFAYLLGIEPECFEHTGGGFKDFSRIGGSDPQMWTAIFDMNRGALLEALDRFQSDIGAFRSAIENGDLDRCRDLIAAARQTRLRLDAGGEEA